MKLSIQGQLRIYAVPQRFAGPGWENFVRNYGGDPAQLLVFEGSNLIVNQGLEWVAKKLGHGLGTPPVQVAGNTISGIADLQVSKIKVGNAASPTAPAAGNTALSDPSPLLTLSSLVVSYPTAASVRFRGTIAPNTVNGEGLTEAGLFITISSVDVLLGRLVISPAVVVVPATSYTVDYTITCAAS